MKGLRAGLFVLGFLLPVPGAEAAEKPSDSDCLICHGEASQARADSRPLGRDLPRFKDSVHGQVGASCVDCHADLASVELPHPEKLAPAQCASCHPATVEQYARSVHAGRAAGKGATCTGCHGVHDIASVKEPSSPTHHLNLAGTCGRCHADAAMLGARAGVPGTFADSIHGQAMTRRGLVVAPNCATCHGSHEVRSASDPQGKVHRANVPGTCGTCHEGIRREYDGSVHAVAVRKGAMGAVCSDCHSAHGIAATVPAWRLGVVRECGACHEESARTYRDGFHGQASTLGYTRVALCADCHGSHGILPKDNPRSRVSPENRVATCARCHPGANARFAAFDPHADPHDKSRNKPVYYTAKFMKLLLAGVFTFFGIHTALWFPRSWQVRRKGHGGAKPPSPPDITEEKTPETKEDKGGSA